ncbi:hypothetical protein GCM10027447_28400 [Glycomyces halotolerans]
MNEPDHYRVLGVSPQAPRTEIQAAYRRRLRQTHPDHGGDETAFHQVQTAWETLADPDSRREYDLLRFGRRAAKRYGRAAARPAHRKVKGWKVKPTTPPPSNPAAHKAPGALVAVPWYARLHKRRPTTKPSLWTELGVCAALSAAWAASGIAFVLTALASTATPLPIRALSIPLALAWALLTIGAALRGRRRPASPDRPTPPKARLTAAALAAATAVWAAGPTSPIGWQLAAFTITGAALVWPARRVRWAAGLRRSVGAALREYNAFGPAGTRPKADRRTGRLLREILTNLPASRLFVALPAHERARIPHAIVCGDRIALLCAPVGRDSDDIDSSDLPEAVRTLTAAIPGAHIRGWTLWPTLPDTADGHRDDGTDHAAVDTAAADIGPWLAAGGDHYDLKVLLALRTRLANVPTQRGNDRAPAVRT